MRDRARVETFGKGSVVPTPRQKTVKRLGNGRRLKEETPERLLREYRAAELKEHKARREREQAARRALAAGVPAEIVDVPSNPDIKIRKNKIHLFPHGPSLRRVRGRDVVCDHGHTVIDLSEELSPACIAELQAKVTNGKVSHDRDVRIGNRWRVERYVAESAVGAD